VTDNNKGPEVIIMDKREDKPRSGLVALLEALFHYLLMNTFGFLYFNLRGPGIGVDEQGATRWRGGK
jgi:hypothetical protein